jgi:hemoglobin
MSGTLYDQIGGFSTVRNLVLDFYERVLDEDDLAPFFADTDMATLVDHQTKFWSMLLGGPASYTEQQLFKLHEAMGIEDGHFDLLAELVVDTLEDHDFEEGAIKNLVQQLGDYRSSIVIPKDASE